VCLTVFVLCAAFCVYTMAGYPLLLFLLARWRPRPVLKAPRQAQVSVILPVHNGEQWIGAKLKSILELNYPPELMEILVVSDGSTDATDSIVLTTPTTPLRSQGSIGHNAEGCKLQLIHLPRQGKATALNAGIERAHGEILFFTDVRQALHRDSLRNLVDCFADPAVGVASGELIIREGCSLEEASVGMYWKYEKWIRRQLSCVDSMMGASGCIYAMRRSLVRRIPPETLVDDMYLPLGAFFQGYRIILDRTAVAYDYPTMLDSEFPRKVRTLAGVYQIIRQYPALLGPSNRMWLHFFSHKVARLLMPYALILAAVVSFGIPAPWGRYILWAQGLFYATAVADRWLPGDYPGKPIIASMRTFSVLMAASLCSVSVLFLPRRNLWKETKVSAARQGD
jgi:biofilm PGA synthesis N-glycosyltransferase PgaC